MPRPKPAEPFVQLPLRLTVAQRDALQAYVDKRGLGSLTEGVRHLIHRTTLAPAVSPAAAVRIGPVEREPGALAKKGKKP